MRVSFLRTSFALCVTLAVHLGSDLTVEASTSSLFPACNATSEASVGDGSCDSENNNEDCEYDGGDCCPCTCADALYTCGTNGYDCRDPAGSDACATASPTSTPLLTSDRADESQYPNCSSVIGYIPYVGDGYCDTQNNNEMCGFDGGDCCACTCVDGAYPCGFNSYNCRDPMVPEWCTEATSPYPNCSSAGGYSWNVDDGYCNSNNNIEECGYDGGDCCACTCDDSQWTCGTGGYDCQDPSVSIECVNASALTLYPDCDGAGGYEYDINDGYCHSENNIEECGYDGGDCCACTCDESGWTSCGFYGYDCQDPSVSIECVNASASLYPDCAGAGGSEYYAGNGYCSSSNNIEECGYDGGDCCACTCVDGDTTCGLYGYDCQDPDVPLWCVNATSRYPDCADAGGLDSNINDGYCQLYNNIEECAYDGGDCCGCTCVDSEWTCGSNGYHCEDPTVPEECINATSQYPDCAGVGGLESNMNDGYCHSYNNNEECRYDGGDCCSCTCVSSEWSCGVVGYDCQDPTVPAECLNKTSPSTWASTDFGYYGYYTYGLIGYPNCSSVGGTLSSIGTGFCESSNNNEDCGYDGGDCCPCTCKGSYCAYYANDCLDPSVPAACANATEIAIGDDYYGDDYYSSCAGYVGNINDGYCDSSNNNEDCAYDGGDCCPCTCVDSEWSCGYSGYDCQDPTAITNCTSAIYPDCETAGGTLVGIGSGYCYDANNIEECGYDGGDCCPCTCVGGSSVCGSSGYDCQDPNAPAECSDNTPTPFSTYYESEAYPDCEAAGGTLVGIGSGYCFDANNIEECGYDGGDCCPCTCVGGSSVCGSNGYDCQDPSAPAECSDDTRMPTSSYYDSSETYPECETAGGVISAVGSGYCSSVNNIEECGYDGGDCCPCTCVDGSTECGSNGYDCQDPAVPNDCMLPYYEALYPECEAVGGSLSWISDGFCSSANNNDECGYDGGDCCQCTCVGDVYPCGYNGYDCEDPTAPSSCLGSSYSSTSDSRVNSECMGEISDIGNGECDVENNNAYCDYDGGDCCSCTCVNADGSACGDQWYDCQDPGANCSARMRTVGVAIITGVSVFAAMLICFVVSRRTVAQRTHLERVCPVFRSAPPAPTRSARPKAVGGVASKPMTEMERYRVKPSDAGIAGGCVVEEGKGEEKISNPEPSAPPLPPSVQCEPLKVVRVKGEASAPKSMSRPLSPLPEGCVVGEEDSEKARDLKPSVSPLPVDTASVEEAEVKETELDIKSTADPSPPLPESSAVDDVDIEEKTEDPESPDASVSVDVDSVEASVSVDINSVEASGAEETEPDLSPNGDPSPTVTESGDDVGGEREEEKETPADSNSSPPLSSDATSSGETKGSEELKTLY